MDDAGVERLRLGLEQFRAISDVRGRSVASKHVVSDLQLVDLGCHRAEDAVVLDEEFELRIVQTDEDEPGNSDMELLVAGLRDPDVLALDAQLGSSSMPPPNTYTPAAFASRTTARAASPTAGRSSSGIAIVALGNEMRYFVMTTSCPTPQDGI